MIQAASPSSSANGIQWNLSDLYSAVDDPAIKKDLATALQRAQAFEENYRGKIEVEGGPNAQLLLEALTELESLREQCVKPYVYASLIHSSKTDEPKNGALLNFAQQQYVQINQHLLFFDLEWTQLDEASAQKLIDDPALKRFRHYLERGREEAPHVLSEPEEKILQQKSITGRSAFVRLFDESVAAIRFTMEVEGKEEKCSLEQVLSNLYESDRKKRQTAAEALTQGLQENSRLLSFIFNNLVADHQNDWQLRRFKDPLGPRNLDNEITSEMVDALMTAAEKYHSTVQRYYKLKGKLLGIDQLCDYDRYAPIFEDLPKCEWPTARQTVIESYSNFSPRAGEIITEFFDKSWIDAELREGKRGGAFSSSAVPSAHPYILMNYTDKLRDVMTLAHELGHGLHQYLSRDVGFMQCDTPLTTAETASVFGEMLTFQRLKEMYDDPKVRLALLCSKIEDAFATVFRQIVLTRFEQSLHKARDEQGELPTEEINKLWMAANVPMHGDVVKMTDDYAWWWLYIGHFIHVPFYCYAYAFGELLVLALVQKYRQEGDAFVPKYLELLASGGSDAPNALLTRLGVDVADPKFWELGLGLLDDMVTEAESLAQQSN